MKVTAYPTPNPNSWKFILEEQVIEKDYAKFLKKENNYEDLDLVKKIFEEFEFIEEIYMFANVFTLSGKNVDWVTVAEDIEELISENWFLHDPCFIINQKNQKKEYNGELKKIYKILEENILPYLQADGGNLELLEYQDNILFIQYQGACGSCPSSTTGTLHAIQNLLKDKYNKDIFVNIVT